MRFKPSEFATHPDLDFEAKNVTLSLLRRFYDKSRRYIPRHSRYMSQSLQIYVPRKLQGAELVVPRLVLSPPPPSAYAENGNLIKLN